MKLKMCAVAAIAVLAAGCVSNARVERAPSTEAVIQQPSATTNDGPMPIVPMPVSADARSGGYDGPPQVVNIPREFTGTQYDRAPQQRLPQTEDDLDQTIEPPAEKPAAPPL